jgi:hypothetical protein
MPACRSPTTTASIVNVRVVSGSVSATALRADLIVGWHCSLSADVTSGCSSDAGVPSYVLIEDSK